MVEYVKGAEPDRWYWRKNCTQYPLYFYQRAPRDRVLTSVTSAKPKKTTKIAQPEEPKRITKKSLINHRRLCNVAKSVFSCFFLSVQTWVFVK